MRPAYSYGNLIAAISQVALVAARCQLVPHDLPLNAVGLIIPFSKVHPNDLGGFCEITWNGFAASLQRADLVPNNDRTYRTFESSHDPKPPHLAFTLRQRLASPINDLTGSATGYINGLF